MSVLPVHWKDWCWSWNANILATWCEELIHLKRPWSWEGLKVGGEGDDRRWAGWLASLTQWTWVWVNSRSWWWTGSPGVLQFKGSQRVRHNWATELNWTVVKEHESFSSILISQDCFGYLGCFVFLYKFFNYLFKFCEKCHW